MGLIGGELRPVVQEYVLNSYTRFDGYDVKEADDYWAKTKSYWAAVRAAWAGVAEARGGIGIKEEAETGTVISARLLDMGTQIVEGKLSEAKAIAEAKALIEKTTRPL